MVDWRIIDYFGIRMLIYFFVWFGWLKCKILLRGLKNII